LPFFRSVRGERWAGYAVVVAIFVSACVALVQTIERFIDPRDLSHLWWLAGAGAIGFIGNEIAAQVRTPLDTASTALPLSRTAITPALTASSASALSRALRLSRSGCLSATPLSASSSRSSSSA